MLENRRKSGEELRKAIIRMIVFFDLFDFPLTVYEIWDNFSKQQKLEEIWEILDKETTIIGSDNFLNKEEIRAIIQYKNGFYFLKGRAEIIATRQQRYNYFCRKIKIARRFTYLFSICPFIQVVAWANVIGAGNLRDGSDIDFFIITSSRRIWLSRLYCTGLTKILHSRPDPRTKKDKICLSFYLSQEHLTLTDLQLKKTDPYFYYWRRKLVLLYNRNRVYENFLWANTKWFKSGVKSPVAKKFFGDFFEQWAKKIQLKIMPLTLKAAINNSDGVVVNDQILKFYQQDRRQEYARKYENKIQQIFKTND